MAKPLASVSLHNAGQHGPLTAAHLNLFSVVTATHPGHGFSCCIRLDDVGINAFL
jgi:hypothetical protein